MVFKEATKVIDLVQNVYFTYNLVREGKTFEWTKNHYCISSETKCIVVLT